MVRSLWLLLPLLILLASDRLTGSGTRIVSFQQGAPYLIPVESLPSFEAVPGELIHGLEGVRHGFESLSMVITRTQPRSGAPLHRHLTEEAHVVLAGTVEYSIAGTRFVADAPFVVRIPAGVMHSFTNIGSEAIQVIGIFPESRLADIDPPQQGRDGSRDAPRTGRPGRDKPFR